MTAPAQRPRGESPLPTLLRFAAAMLAGLGFALAHVAWKCRVPDSEACVWGKSLAIIGVPVETAVVGFGLFGAMMVVARARRSGSQAKPRAPGD